MAVSVGVLLRLRQFAVDRSLWVDEALLARNVIQRDLGGLLDPLSGQQGAPVGYLWILRAMVSAVGEDEAWMRLPSLVAGLALLPLVWLLGRRLFSRRTATVGVALVAVSPGLIRYSVELKQYALDATVAVALVLFALVVDDQRTATRHVQLGVAGVVAVWLSHPAVLVLGGMGVVLLVRRLRARDGEGVAALALIGATWAVSLGVLYLVSLRDLTGNEFLTDYWRAGFPGSLRPDDVVGWMWSTTVDLLGGVGGFDAPGLVAATVVSACVAAIVWGRARRVVVLLAFVPPLLLAAVLEQYPYRGRLALFALPFLLVVLASLVELPGRVPRVAAGVLLAALAAGPVLQSVDELRDPLLFPQSREVIAYVADHAHPDDRIWVHGLAHAPFSVYGPRNGLSSDARVSWRPLDACEGATRTLGRERGTVWVVFAYTHSASPPDEAEILRTHLDAVGRRVDMVEGHDAFAARYDLEAPPDDPSGADLRVTPDTGCLRVLER